MYAELNTATPLLDVTVVVPSSSAEELPVPGTIDMVTATLAPDTTLPTLFTTWMVGDTALVTPAIPPVGCVEKDSATASLETMLKVDETTSDSPDAEKLRV